MKMYFTFVNDRRIFLDLSIYRLILGTAKTISFIVPVFLLRAHNSSLDTISISFLEMGSRLFQSFILFNLISFPVTSWIIKPPEIKVIW